MTPVRKPLRQPGKIILHPDRGIGCFFNHGVNEEDIDEEDIDEEDIDEEDIVAAKLQSMAEVAGVVRQEI